MKDICEYKLRTGKKLFLGDAGKMENKKEKLHLEVNLKFYCDHNKS